MAELASAISALRANEQLRAIIFTGTPGVFSAGADLSEVARLDPTTALDFLRLGQAVFNLIATAAPITLAAIDGYCLGGGLDLALACDLRYATPRSTFQYPGAKRGIITGWGGTQRLPRLIGRAEALRLMMTAERIEAPQARRIGLINAVCDDALDHAVKIAGQL